MSPSRRAACINGAEEPNDKVTTGRQKLEDLDCLDNCSCSARCFGLAGSSADYPVYASALALAAAHRTTGSELPRRLRRG